MSRLLRVCAPLAVCALLALTAASSVASSGAPGATAAAKCSLTLTQQRNLGTTYVFSLNASGTSCRAARKVAKAYHECRHRKGKGGSCGSVSGYSCSERRYNKSRFSYDATATCSASGKKVVQKYQQNI